jgi:DNA-binding response OmpR family regulator
MSKRSMDASDTTRVSAEDVDDTTQEGLPDLYLIDVNLPGEDGFSLAQRIRASQPLVGIVLITARSRLDDRVDGYSRGADAYLLKPVEQAEILACINSLGRRVKSTRTQNLESLTFNSQTLNLSGPAGTVALTHGEGLLLSAFGRAAGHKLERWQAMQLVDTKDKGLVPANLEMRISALRKKLTACGAPDGAIRTLRGVGYALCCPMRVL